MSGGRFSPWVNQEGVAIACCTDGFRPVVFKIERVDWAIATLPIVLSDAPKDSLAVQLGEEYGNSQ